MILGSLVSGLSNDGGGGGGGSAGGGGSFEKSKDGGGGSFEKSNAGGGGNFVKSNAGGGGSAGMPAPATAGPSISAVKPSGDGNPEF